MLKLLAIAAICAAISSVVLFTADARPVTDSASKSDSLPSLCFANGNDGWLAKQNQVYFTTNAGRSWQLSFSGAFQAAKTFRATIECAGKTAWVLFVGFGAASDQQPYVVYLTKDAGVHWRAPFEEGYFESIYPKARARRNLGGLSGPFTVVNSKTAYFLGRICRLGLMVRSSSRGRRTQGGRGAVRPFPASQPSNRSRFTSPQYSMAG